MQQPARSRQHPQRVVVVGCCGAGKTTFSAGLARRLGVPHVERDALGELGSDAYRGAVTAIVSTEGWVFDGPPYFMDDLVYSAAQSVIWLDYTRELVLWRAMRRSLQRTFAVPGTGPNGWWRLRQWVAPGGPRFAYSVYVERRREFRRLERDPRLAGKVRRFGGPIEAQGWLASLEATEDQRQ